MSKVLIDAVDNLDKETVMKEVKALKDKNAKALDIIGYLQEGMAMVGKRFEKKEYFLSELIMSAEISKEASGILGDIDTRGSYNKSNHLCDLHIFNKEGDVLC